ncbi:MAG: TIGR02281 family clan AA aspartic protease [Gammaproteobacteria bacterium]|nr:TIGR02281 family clan AA aspartic protease [Gammaproteobacteria bacterium]
MARILIPLLVGLGVWLAAGTAHAVKKLNLLALFEGKAMLYIDGERRMLSIGDVSPEGVKLISANPEAAVVEIDGRREDLRLGMATTFVDANEPAADDSTIGSERVSLWADHSGFFHVDGMINGFPVRFLVDTGATTVAISSELAERIGLNLSSGRRGVASTAGGMAPMVGVSLESVSIGDITLRDVDAGVIMGSFPETPLLGMSFLGQLDMLREGNRMELRRRF